MIDIFIPGNYFQNILGSYYHLCCPHTEYLVNDKKAKSEKTIKESHVLLAGCGLVLFCNESIKNMIKIPDGVKG